MPPRAADGELARPVVESAGADGREELNASADGPLTRDGLEAVRDAVLGAS